jgi:hypothetical protein
MIVVHCTVLHDAGLVREFGRLLWLVLDAAHFPDIGPDASIEATRGTHLDGAALRQLLPGKTLIVGAAVSAGPYRIRLDADGTATAFRGREPVQYDSGSWLIQGDRFCRDWQKTTPPHLCLTVVADVERIDFFTDNGLMFFRARVSDD